MFDAPLGLPAGSIRALFTIGVVFSLIYAILQGIALPEWYQAIVAVVIAFYFGTRAGESVPKDPCEG